MPKLTKTPPKYRRKVVQRKNDKDEYAVTRIQGKDILLGRYNTKESKAKYHRLIAEWEEHRERTPAKATALTPNTITHVSAEYLRFAKGYYAKDEVGCIKVSLRFLLNNYSSLVASEFGPMALQNVRQEMINAGHSRNYINANVGRIRRMFKWAVSRELVHVSTFNALATVSGLRKNKSSARETAPIQPIAKEIILQTIDYAIPVVADMIQVQYLTACRPGELLGMRPGDIENTSAAWIYRPESHKMTYKGRSREIILGARTQQILAPYLVDKNENEFCFLTPRQKRFQRASYARWIAKACQLAGVERWSPNRLRHSSLTEIRAFAGLEASQAVAGHKNADVTQIYAERDTQLAIRTIHKLDSSLLGR